MTFSAVENEEYLFFACSEKQLKDSKCILIE